MRRREIVVLMVAGLTGLVTSSDGAWGQTPSGGGTAEARLQPVSAEVVQDQMSGRYWTATDNGADVSWPEAEAICRELELGPATGWRLATVDELETLVERRGLPLKVVGAIDLSAFWVWSSDHYEGPPEEGQEEPMAWFVSFNSGKRGVTHQARSEGLRVLCVSDP